MSHELVTKVEEGFSDLTLTSLLLGSTHLVEQKKWPTYDGTGMLNRNNYLSASSMSKCLRLSWYSKQTGDGLGDFVMNGYADRGNAVEAWIVERLSVIEQQGYRLSYTGGDQRSFYDVATGISGTPDGLLYTKDKDGDDRYILLEFKSIDPRVNRRNLPKKAHVMQVQVNMHLVSLCLGIDIQESRLIYIDASDFAKQDEYVVRRHGDYWREAVSRSIQLNGAGSAEDLPPEGLKNGDCDTCNFASRCSAAINVTATAIKAGSESGFFPPAEDSALTNAETDTVMTFLKLREEVDALEVRLDEAKNATKAIVLDHGSVVNVDGSTISVAVQAGKETLDMKAIAAAGVDLSAYKKTGAPFTIMRVRDA